MLSWGQLLGWTITLIGWYLSDAGDSYPNWDPYQQYSPEPLDSGALPPTDNIRVDSSDPSGVPPKDLLSWTSNPCRCCECDTILNPERHPSSEGFSLVFQKCLRCRPNCKIKRKQWYANAWESKMVLEPLVSFEFRMPGTIKEKHQLHPADTVYLAQTGDPPCVHEPDTPGVTKLAYHFHVVSPSPLAGIRWTLNAKQLYPQDRSIQPDNVTYMATSPTKLQTFWRRIKQVGTTPKNGELFSIYLPPYPVQWKLANGSPTTLMSFLLNPSKVLEVECKECSLAQMQIALDVACVRAFTKVTFKNIETKLRRVFARYKRSAKGDELRTAIDYFSEELNHYVLQHFKREASVSEEVRDCLAHILVTYYNRLASRISTHSPAFSFGLRTSIIAKYLGLPEYTNQPFFPECAFDYDSEEDDDDVF